MSCFHYTLEETFVLVELILQHIVFSLEKKERDKSKGICVLMLENDEPESVHILLVPECIHLMP